MLSFMCGGREREREREAKPSVQVLEYTNLNPHVGFQAED